MASLADTALQWFDQHARDLPWRRPEVSPWGVLVSEVMLQQTPVARVLPVWAPWLSRWPRPADLAVSAPAEAIRAWGRLGYPRRALRLHACAVRITERHEGRVPATVADLERLPGVGSYTARAVACFAYGEAVPVVDTNVRRLMARAVTGAPDAGPATTAADLAVTRAQLPGDPARAARASAAFMELGALVCTARAPRCGACPAAALCQLRADGTELPAGPTRPRQRYAGTDRQVRGLLLAVLREAPGPVPAQRLDPVWPEAVQRERALDSLLADGLVRRIAPGVYDLPGAGPS